MEKEQNYKVPMLELVRTDERGRVFFAASGTLSNVSISSLTSTDGNW